MRRFLLTSNPTPFSGGNGLNRTKHMVGKHEDRLYNTLPWMEARCVLGE